MAEKEEVLSCEEKLKKYEEFISQVIDGTTQREGFVLAKAKNGLYKIRTNNEEILATSKRIPNLKKGDAVIIANGTVIERLPEELMPEKEAVEFEKINWSAVGGMKSQIDAIRRKVEYPTKYAKLYKEFKLQPSRGILLYGPTGCGKTLIAKVIASSMLNVKNIDKNLFIYMKGGELLSKFVGEAEGRIKSAFESARRTYKSTKIQPIIFIDEAEAILPPRGSRFSSDVDTTIVPTFLSEMDGFEGYNPFVILATNYEDKIDVAILRPGRIDLKVYIGHPSYDDSVDIFKIYLAKTKIDGDITTMAHKAADHLFEEEKLQGDLSGALIENIVDGAIENAIIRVIATDGKTTAVTSEDIIKSINNI
jgi:ATPases of the AAA+ class